MSCKKPTQREKIAMYELVLDQVALRAETGDKNFHKLINNICNWSYAHRVGNGELSEKQQEKIVTKAFWQLIEIN